MELNRFVRSFSLQPSVCRGAETVGLMALGSGLSLFGTAMTNESNQDINLANRRFSALEAEKQRQWQSDEWNRQYNIQRAEWYNQLKSYSDTQWQQFLREAEYNSPKNQVSRLQQAGLNPSAVLGGQGSSGLVSAASGNIGSVGSPSPPSGGTVSGASASAPSQIPMQQASIYSSMGSMLRDLAAASKDSKLTEPMVALLGSQFIGQNLKNEWQTFENEILSRVKDARVQRAFADLRNSFADYAVKSAMYENYSADTVLKAAETALTVAKEKCTDKEFEAIQFAVAHQFETWKTEQDLKRSQVSSNYASARYNNALAKTEDDIRQFKVDNLDLLNKYQDTMNNIAKNDYKIQNANVENQIKTTATELAEKAKREGILTSQAQQTLEKAIKENDWWLVQNIIGPLAEHISNKQDKAADRVAGIVPMLVK